MIKEAYCSDEVSTLLMQSGFKAKCSGLTGIIFEDNKKPLPEVTHQFAMAWLRDVHKIGIFPSTYTFTDANNTKESHPYGTAIINLNTFELMCDDIMPRDTYEDAVEAALKYVLENLI